MKEIKIKTKIIILKAKIVRPIYSAPLLLMKD